MDPILVLFILIMGFFWLRFILTIFGFIFSLIIGTLRFWFFSLLIFLIFIPLITHQSKENTVIESKNNYDLIQNPPNNITIYFIIIIFIIIISLVFLKFYKNKIKIDKKTQVDEISNNKKNTVIKEHIDFQTEKEKVNTVETIDKVRIVEKKNKVLTIDEFDLDSMRVFRERNDWVKVDVHTNFVSPFLSQCDWYKKRTGKFPNLEDQIHILKDITYGWTLIEKRKK